MDLGYFDYAQYKFGCRMSDFDPVSCILHPVSCNLLENQ